MHLVADVLDQQLEDARGERAGRIDGIVLQLRDGRPPRVIAVEVSPITLIARFSRRGATWYARLDARLGPGRGAPFRIPWSRVRREGTLLRMDLVLAATPIDAFNGWLYRTIVRRVPGMH